MNSRRDMLKVCLAAGTTVLLDCRTGISSASILRSPTMTSQDVLDVLQELFSPQSAYIRIGARYIEEYDVRLTPDQLLRHVVAGHEQEYVRNGALVRERLPGFIAEKISRDFADGRTLLVDGWILSQTELNLCALLSAIRHDNAG